MNVTLIDYTGCGSPDPANYAAGILIFTKNTRLSMDEELLGTIQAYPSWKKHTELEYMATTNPASHEFVHLTFLIQGVTRACTQQLERTRTASFAERSLRVVDIRKGFEFATGPTVEVDGKRKLYYKYLMNEAARGYAWLIENGAAIEDARGALPLNTLTTLTMSINMRNFVALVRKRSSPRTQSEYRDVIERMKLAVVAVYPWMVLFIDRDRDRILADLDREIQSDTGPEGSLPDMRRKRMLKLVDQLRTEE
jgi:flavin-dependent thymidylate synthase